ncbi:MAG: tetratricopeptide repeat protein [Vicinamibacterales bacterium]
MRLVDSRGVPLSTEKPASLAGYENALEMLHGHCGDPLATINEALANDPEFVMGHCLRAALLAMSAEEDRDAELGKCVATAQALDRAANDRERRHTAAAHAWWQGDLDRAVRLYGGIVIDYPRDSLALWLANFGDFHLGRAAMLRDRVAQVLPHWNSAVPGYAYVLAMYAFGLEETALYDSAEEIGRQALELNGRNPGAIHAIAHVMEMQGRQAEGIAWLNATRPEWVSTRYAVHNWWHLALFHLDLEETAQALDIYDLHMRVGDANDTPALVDASALLWRLHLRGVDVGCRWGKLAQCWESKKLSVSRSFNAIHAMMAFVAGGRESTVQRLLTNLRLCASKSGANARLLVELGVVVCEALAAFGKGNYHVAVERLTRVRHIAHGFGGSHAQRDLIHLMLVESALRSRQPRLARALASERTALKPTSPFNQSLAARAQARLTNIWHAQDAPLRARRALSSQLPKAA